MTVHALAPGSQQLALCFMGAYRQGNAAKTVLRFIEPYGLTRQPHLVTCADCKEWAHA